MSNNSSTGGALLPLNDEALNDEALDSLFQDAIAAITGLNPRYVVRRYKAEPEAPPQFDGTWAAVGVMGIDPDQFPQQGLRKDGAYVMVHHERLEVMASFYGAKAQQAASDAYSGILIAQNREGLEAANIFYREVDRPVKAPALINGRWSNRIDVTFTFARAVERQFAILPLLEIQGAVTPGGGITSPFSVTPD